MRITFSDLKKISESIERGDDGSLVDYLNSFDGQNVYEKFITILKAWELDVSHDLSFNLGDRAAKITLKYILDQFSTFSSDDFEIVSDDIKFLIQTPNIFNIPEESIPIYDIIKKIEISGYIIELDKLPYNEKKLILNKLPGRVYNTVITGLLNNKSKIIKLDHSSLSKVKLNFLTFEPFIFLKGLLSPYGGDYFRDILFHLSRRIDASILMDSTLRDVEYYISKYNEELKDTSKPASG